MKNAAFHAEGDMSRFEASPDGIIVHTNEALVCRDCAFRWRPVGSCEKYQGRKPKGVLDGGPSCPYYEKDDTPREWELD